MFLEDQACWRSFNTDAVKCWNLIFNVFKFIYSTVISKNVSSTEFVFISLDTLDANLLPHKMFYSLLDGSI